MSAQAKQENVLVIQSGGSTPVMNRSLYGIVREVYERGGFGEVLGATHGLDGVLDGQFMDLRAPSKATWERTAKTPAAALGSSRRKLEADDVPKVLDILSEHAVRYCFIIGGNDSADTGNVIAAETRTAGRSLTVINIPKTIDNDLVLTDHSPGYGSAARFVALATMGAGRDAESMGKASPITVVEVMGRDAGWLAASAALGKRDDRDAPHVVCVPEVPVDERRFLDLMENAYRRYGFAVAIVAENARGTSGVLGNQQEPWYVDEFGHPYFEGAGRHLAALVGTRLNVRTRYEKPGTIQRSLAAVVSRSDAEEAEMVGRAAVRYALEGASGQMVTLVREGGKEYSCSTGLAPLDRVADKVRTMPEEYLDRANYMVQPPFMDYATPLVGTPFPKFGRIS